MLTDSQWTYTGDPDVLGYNRPLLDVIEDGEGIMLEPQSAECGWLDGRLVPEQLLT